MQLTDLIAHSHGLTHSKLAFTGAHANVWTEMCHVYLAAGGPLASFAQGVAQGQNAVGAIIHPRGPTPQEVHSLVGRRVDLVALQMHGRDERR